MKKNININRLISILLILPFIFSILNLNISFASNNTIKMVYPLKVVAKLSCRFQNFKDLSPNCKENLPILKVEDYKKYIKLNWWYNEYTRRYTTLWWASYKYGWDVGFGWHEWVDIATSKWTPVYSIAKWKVIIAKRELWWGSVVTIQHYIRWKKVFSNYAHMSKILVKKWQEVYAWTEIWEVWSEWNSTWNHLHFQIDLDTPFHPFYYSRKTCNYSYSDITEKWVCFNELARNTIDPILFLETKWAILDKINTSNTNKISRSTFKKTSTNSNVISSKYNTNNFMDIFNKTVYKWYWERNIKDVQKVFKTLGYYKWIIDWNYSHLEPYVIEYQLKRWIISSKNENWAGWFWPKTRAQAKKDYLKIIWNKWQKLTTFKKTVTINDTSWIKIQKIQRKNILTRAEIEKREINDFLRRYTINLSFSNIAWNVLVGWHINLNIEIKSKNRNRNIYFKWNTPLNFTFPVDNKNINVFPTKLYNFSDWKRTVKITWLKEWITKLQVRFWAKILKIFNIKVVKSWKVIYPYKAFILWKSRIIYWEEWRWIILMKWKHNENLINLRYGSSFKLKTNSDVSVCIKKGSLKNIVKIYKSKCKPSDFKDEINFDYNSTVWGLVLFDFKVKWNNPKITLVNNYKNIKMAFKNIYVANPKDIKSNYVYHDDVLNMLKRNIVTWINRWYFLYNRDLTAWDAIDWIRNSLIKLKQNSVDIDMKNRINTNLLNLNKEKILRYKPITRKKFLELTYKYLYLDNSKWYISKNYRDVDSKMNKEIWMIFKNNITWKDEYWKYYFRPNTYIKRWEAAFVLNQAYKNNQNYFLTLR